MISVSDFKEWFVRDFPYLPEYIQDKVYFAGDIVYVSPNFYQSLVDNNTADVTDTESWQVIKEDESYYINDGDIEKAISEATLGFRSEPSACRSSCHAPSRTR